MLQRAPRTPTLPVRTPEWKRLKCDRVHPPDESAPFPAHAPFPLVIRRTARRRQIGMETLRQPVRLGAGGTEQLKDRELRILRSQLRDAAAAAGARPRTVAEFVVEAAALTQGVLSADDVLVAAERAAEAGMPGESPLQTKTAAAAAASKGELRVPYMRLEQKLVVKQPPRPPAPRLRAAPPTPVLSLSLPVPCPKLLVAPLRTEAR